MILLFLAGATAVLLFVMSPSEIVEKIGVRNGYLLAFVLALTGGVSMFTTLSFHATIVTLALGGLEPFFLALASAPALFIGDSLFFLLGTRGRKAFLSRHEATIETWVRRLRETRGRYIPYIIYGYTGLTPLPLDILMVALALLKYPYRKIIVPVLLGHLTLLTLIGYAAQASS